MTSLANKILTKLLCIYASIILCNCELGDKSPKPANVDTLNQQSKGFESQSELDRLAFVTVFTNPAPNTEILNSTTNVRFDIRESEVEIEKAVLLVDGEEVATDDGEPWQIEWPSYFWADGKDHSLKLKLVTGSGNEVVAFEQLKVKVSSTISNKLNAFTHLHNQRLELDFLPEVQLTPMEFDKLIDTNFIIQLSTASKTTIFEQSSTTLDLGDLPPNIYKASYKISSKFGNHTHTGPDSPIAEFIVSKPSLPEIYPVQITENNDQYEAILSWEKLDEYSRYQINITAKDNPLFNIQTSTYENHFTLPELPAGYYTWTLQRENSQGYMSERSAKLLFDVGVEYQSYGGAGIKHRDIPIKCSTNESLNEIIDYEILEHIGEWDIYPGCIVGRGQGDRNLIFNTHSKNFSYGANITVLEGSSAALVFYAEDRSHALYASLNTIQDKVKLWRSDPKATELTFERFPDLENNKTYHLLVEKNESEISIYLDEQQILNFPSPTFEASTNMFVGVNVYKSTSLFENITILDQSK